MEINIAQVLTQAIAFLIFLVVLRIYAWKPVMRILEARRGQIKAEFERINRLEQEVQQMKQDYQARLREMENEARSIRMEEINRGREIAEKIVQEAHQGIAEERQRLEQQLAIEMAKAKVDLRDFIVELSLQAVSKLVHQELNEKSHRRLVDEYIRQVTEIRN